MLDGCYTRLLRSAFDISWKAHMSNERLYGDLPKVSDKVRKRRLQFAGHCVRSSGQVVLDLVLWKPLHGRRSVGRPIMTYVDLLCQDTGQTSAEIKTCMENRRVRRVIIDVRQMSTEWVSEWVMDWTRYLDLYFHVTMKDLSCCCEIQRFQSVWTMHAASVLKIFSWPSNSILKVAIK